MISTSLYGVVEDITVKKLERGTLRITGRAGG
jgi:hypothetical protein